MTKQDSMNSPASVESEAEPIGVRVQLQDHESVYFTRAVQRMQVGQQAAENTAKRKVVVLIDQAKNVANLQGQAKEQAQPKEQPPENELGQAPLLERVTLEFWLAENVHKQWVPLAQNARCQAFMRYPDRLKGVEYHLEYAKARWAPLGEGRFTGQMQVTCRKIRPTNATGAEYAKKAPENFEFQLRL